MIVRYEDDAAIHIGSDSVFTYAKDVDADRGIYESEVEAESGRYVAAAFAIFK